MIPELALSTRDRAACELPHIIHENGIAASGEGRFRNAVFARDGAYFALLTLEKPQNGEFNQIKEGIRKTIETTALFQGKKFDALPWQEPGKIPHEIQGGDCDQDRLAQIKMSGGPVYEVNGHLEMVNYYALDATPMWICMYHDYVKATGDLEFRDKYWNNFERALEWMELYGDLDGDGLIEGLPPHPNAAANPWWKDSNTSLIDEDGNYPSMPIVPLDVNVFAYQADLKASDLYIEKGNYQKGVTLRVRAMKRKELINKLFWNEELGNFVPALDGGKNQIVIDTSDSAIALWQEAVDPDKQRRVADRLVKPDLLTKDGLRTRSRYSRQYRPKEYQNGAVWGQLSGIAASGCEKTGFHQHAEILDNTTIDSVEDMGGFRELAEVDDDGNITEYEEGGVPVACRPQTWVIGSILNRTARFAVKHH